MAKIDEFYLTDIAHKSDLVLTAKGGFDTISGLANVKEALFRRLLTVPGTLIHRPNYGVGIKLFQNKLPDMETKRTIVSRIQDQFEQDVRVEKVVGVSITNEDKTPDLVRINVRVKLVGYGEQTFGFSPFEAV